MTASYRLSAIGPPHSSLLTPVLIQSPHLRLLGRCPFVAEVGQVLGQGLLFERRRDDDFEGALKFAVRALMVGDPLLLYAPDGDQPAEDVEAENL